MVCFFQLSRIFGGENRIYEISSKDGSTKHFPYYTIEQYAKIVEAFKQKPEPEIEAPLINGYKAHYKKGNKTVNFGCAQISIVQLCHVSNSLNPTNGNRTIQSITLDSGVVITTKQIGDIFKYIDYIDAEK